MAKDKLRSRVACEAARLMVAQEESHYVRAKLTAARRIYQGELKPGDLPSHREIRREVQTLLRRLAADRHTSSLAQMRQAALEIMHLVRQFHPRLAGTTLTGGVRPGAPIQLHVFSDSVLSVAAALEAEGFCCEIRPNQAPPGDTSQLSARIRIADRFPVELSVAPADLADGALRSAATGRALEQATIAELEQLMLREQRGAPPEPLVREVAGALDRFRLYEMLLLPLEHVKQNPQTHPEGDVLYHSLQVFELARARRAYDEELLLAALLHDVGKAIDPHDHLSAALEVLGDCVTPRTAWLIEHHAEALAIRDGTLGVRSRRRLEANEDFEDLLLLAECDAQGRQTGVPVADVAEALAYLRQLAAECGEE